MENKMINLTYKFLRENYDYVYLKSRIRLAQKSGKNTTLIVGSSHGLNGIDAYCFENAINCSMHGQDIYYDKLCIENFVDTDHLNERGAYKVGMYLVNKFGR